MDPPAPLACLSALTPYENRRRCPNGQPSIGLGGLDRAAHRGCGRWLACVVHACICLPARAGWVTRAIARAACMRLCCGCLRCVCGVARRVPRVQEQQRRPPAWTDHYLRAPWAFGLQPAASTASDRGGCRAMPPSECLSVGYGPEAGVPGAPSTPPLKWVPAGTCSPSPMVWTPVRRHGWNGCLGDAATRRTSSSSLDDR